MRSPTYFDSVQGVTSKYKRNTSATTSNKVLQARRLPFHLLHASRTMRHLQFYVVVAILLLITSSSFRDSSKCFTKMLFFVVTRDAGANKGQGGSNSKRASLLAKSVHTYTVRFKGEAGAYGTPGTTSSQ